MTKLSKVLRGTAIALASIGVFCPQLAYASNQNTANISPKIRDVALQNDGMLAGQVLDSQGAPVSGTKVVIAQRDQVLAETLTDASGRYAVTGLRGGVYQVVTTHGGGYYRLWAPNTAPPIAQPQALIVNGDTVVRGGLGGGVLGALANPWVLGGIVAAAIAIPLALDDDGS